LRFGYRLPGTEQVNALQRDLTDWFPGEVHPHVPRTDNYPPQYDAAAEQRTIRYRRGAPTFHISKQYASIERLLRPLAKRGRDGGIALAISVYRRAGWQAAGTDGNRSSNSVALLSESPGRGWRF
jgi:hypothetical protein